MPALPIHYRRVHGPATSDNVDDNFLTLATAIETLQADADDNAAGLDVVYQTDDGSGLIVRATDGREWGPFYFGGGLNPMGDHAPGIGYAKSDFVRERTASYLCTAPHVATVFADDLAAGKWMLVANDGAAGDPGTGVGGGNIYLTGQVIGDLIESGPTASKFGIAIPKACRLVAVTARVMNGPGAAKSLAILMSRFDLAGTYTAAGHIQFNGTTRLGVISGAAIGFEFAAGDMLAVGVSSATAGHTTRDLAVTLEFEPL